MARDVVRIGTRASELALRQGAIVQSALASRGVAVEIVKIRTAGDKKTQQPLGSIGATGLFTKELETALLRKKVDCCVHSLKDLPTEPRDGLELVAILEREDPRDVLVINPVTDASNLADLPAGSRVGTSSPRRRAQLMAARPDLDVVEMRGNVQARLKKMDEGKFHAAVLAAAGLIRLDARQRIAAFLEPPEWLPAAGQGAIAVQIRSADARLRALLEPLDHAPTRMAVAAERAFLGALEGGCQSPIGALAMPSAEGGHVLHGLISDLAGSNILRGSRAIDQADPELSGHELAAELRSRGGASILAELRGARSNSLPHTER
ncbi:MAG TPA: hydroxymethylbilane synthase [Gemmatimonadaceae bacterium]|nr:hydroxymethylbilane synthase [Gemmatimonadaceae bacterium]